MEGEEREGKGREETLVCFAGKEGKKLLFVLREREGKGKEIRVFPSNLSNFGKIDTLTKNIHPIPPNHFPSNPFPFI